ncbi:vitamin K epoxide reductase family protein [Brevibacillus sp. SYSU BS000544]|uniref:vitamin K epoxide reductase family protein n=1 Tax=Brevibacillus sp. SYSU BS000544 TaxID=3416443 RepID=UPI003CE4AC46
MTSLRPTVVMYVLAVLGVLVSGYLFLAKVANQFFCPIGECQQVNDSVYAYIGPLPVSLIGVSYYLFLLALLLFVQSDQTGILRRVLEISLFLGLIYSVYLTYVELFVLNAVCMWCVSSFLIVIGLNGIYFFARVR